MSNYCRKNECARKTSMSKKVLRPCLESLRIPLTPCVAPVNPSVINHPLCHYRNYSKCSPEMCNTIDFRPCPDICPFSHKYYRNDNNIDGMNRRDDDKYLEDNRIDESFARRVADDEYDEAADLRDEERNPNIEKTNDEPTKMRSVYNRNNNHDDVHHVGTLAAPKMTCKGSQIPIKYPARSDFELNNPFNQDSNQKPDPPWSSDKEIETPNIKTNEDINQPNRSQANQTNPNINISNNLSKNNINSEMRFPEYGSDERFVPSQSRFSSIQNIHEINRSTTGFVSPPRYSGPIDRIKTRPTLYPSNEIQDGRSCCMNKLPEESQSYINASRQMSYRNMAHDNVAPKDIPYLHNSPRTRPRETCCKGSGLINADTNLPRFNSKYQALLNSNRSKDRLFRRKKSMRSVVCACPDEYELYSREVKCSRKTCEWDIDTTSCASVSCAANQGPSCRCRYPPLFKQFSCAGNINGTCNCVDNI